MVPCESDYQAALLTYPDKRVPIISRSTFVGSGQWAAHWLGDNFATWDDMRTSIIGISEFNMFGYPLVGADICGFNLDSNAELCLRWQQMGAFYPFSRNHNAKGNIDQDPAAWGPEVANASQRSAGITISIYCPILYTLFYRAAYVVGNGRRPLAFEFPDDPRRNWLINNSFGVTICS